MCKLVTSNDLSPEEFVIPEKGGKPLQIKVRRRRCDSKIFRIP
jgi:hypothetical protein